MTEPRRCLVCGSVWNMDDLRRRYCSPECFAKSRPVYYREWKRKRREIVKLQEAARRRRYRSKPEVKAKIAAREQRPEVKARRLLLWHAREEARSRGLSTRDVLVEWRAPVGQAAAALRPAFDSPLGRNIKQSLRCTKRPDIHTAKRIARKWGCSVCYVEKVRRSLGMKAPRRAADDWFWDARRPLRTTQEVEHARP